MTREVALTLPRNRDFYEIAHLVVGGVAARHDVTFEHLDDLQLALREVLGRAGEDEPIVTVAMSVDGATMRARVGPLGGAVTAELARGDGSELGLRRLLDTVLDEVELERGDGGDWLQLTKTLPRAEA